MQKTTLANLGSLVVVGSGTTAALGVFLFDVSLKNGLLLVVATAICALLFKATAASRHLIWTATLAGLLVMPLFSLLTPQWQILPNWMAIETANAATSPANIRDETISPILDMNPIAKAGMNEDLVAKPQKDETVSNSGAAPNRSNRAFASSPSRTLSISIESLLVVWLIGTAFCLLPVLLGFVRLNHLESTDQRKENSETLAAKLAPLKSQIQSFSRELGITPPRLIISSDKAMPMVWQLIGSRLLLPISVLAWSQDRLDSVLRHELVHLRRRDPLTLLLAQVARAFNWFNPLAWYAFHQMRIERERACDDYVLRNGIRADQYATHLLDLATSLQPANNVETVALSMASKSNVESRLSLILNHSLNRKKIGKASVATLLGTVLLLVVAFSTLAASTNSFATSDNVETLEGESMPDIKWPYNDLKVSDLTTRSLADAVKQFNVTAKQNPIGSSQPPITTNEILKVIERDLADEKVKADVKTILREIKKTSQLPPSVYLRRFTRFDDEQKMHGVWWVRLHIKTDDVPVYAISIRTDKIYTRDFSQMERQQSANRNIALIGRFSSYFETPPTRRPLIEDLGKRGERLANEFQSALDDGDLEKLKQLFVWQGATQPTRDFVESELNSLLESKIESVTYRPRDWEGNLINWQSFHTYKPNLEIEGYIDIKHQTPTAVQARTLSLEVGKTPKAHRLINYVLDKTLEMPKKIEPLISMSGEMFDSFDKLPATSDPKPRQPYLTTWIIENPGALVSAHLANEEIWMREIQVAAAKPNVKVESDLETEPSANAMGNTKEFPVVKGRKLKDEEKEFWKWGETINGLQAAVDLSKLEISVPNNGPFYTKFAVRNVSDQVIEFDSEDWRQNDRFWVTTADAKATLQQAHGQWFSGQPQLKTYRLQPNELVVLKTGELTVIGPDEGHDMSTLYLAVLKPGKYNVQFELNIPGFQIENDHWKGLLKTGKTEISISERGKPNTESNTPPSPKVSEPNDDANVINIGDPGDDEPELTKIQVSGTLVDANTGKPILKSNIVQGGNFDPANPDKKTEWGFWQQQSHSPNGKFSAQLKPAEGWTARILVDGYLPQPIDLKSLPPGQNPKIELKLTPGGMYSGRILDHRGLPLAGAKLFAIGPEGVNVFHGNAMRHGKIDTHTNPVTTDDDGAFRELILPTGRMAITSPRFSAWPFVVERNETDVEIQLPKPGTLEIKYNINGAPDEAECLLQLLTHLMGDEWRGLQLEQTQMELRRGTTTISGLPPGRYQIFRNQNIQFASVGYYEPLQREFFDVKPGETTKIDWTSKKTGARVKADLEWNREIALDGIKFIIQSQKEISGLGKGWAYNLDAGKLDLETGKFITSKIPPGSYRLRIEANKIKPKQDKMFISGFLGPDYFKSIEFRIPEEGEPELDLGTIELDDLK